MVSWLFPQDIPEREQASETYQHGLLKSRGMAGASLMNASLCSPSVIPAKAGIHALLGEAHLKAQVPPPSFLRKQESSLLLCAGTSPSWKGGAVFGVGMREN